MPYVTAGGRITRGADLSLAASAARTTSVAGTAVEVGDAADVRLLLDVTAVAGTPTLDVTIETSFDGSTSWRSLGTFAQKTAVSSERKSFGGCDRFVRANWVIAGGTPSLTFSITGEAV
jgi:hypothetical protein